MTVQSMTPLHLCLSATPRLPRDGFGRRASPSGRALLRDAAGRAAGLRDAPARAADGRWHWPDSGWRGSVSHVAEHGLAAVAHGTWIGVDLQDERPRPAALGWLARVLDRPREQVGFREWAEVEALRKAQGVGGIRPERMALPPWRPGWRRTADGWWLASVRLPGAHLALAAQRPLLPRWSALEQP